MHRNEIFKHKAVLYGYWQVYLLLNSTFEVALISFYLTYINTWKLLFLISANQFEDKGRVMTEMFLNSFYSITMALRN